MDLPNLMRRRWVSGISNCRMLSSAVFAAASLDKCFQETTKVSRAVVEFRVKNTVGPR
jgi:hypothetical protein